MDKRKGVVIAIALLLLFGTGTFVFANPSEEEGVIESTGGGPNVKKSDTNTDGINTTPPVQTDEGLDDTTLNDGTLNNQEENQNTGNTTNRPSGNHGNYTNNSNTSNNTGNVGSNNNNVNSSGNNSSSAGNNTGSNTGNNSSSDNNNSGSNEGSTGGNGNTGNGENNGGTDDNNNSGNQSGNSGENTGGNTGDNNQGGDNSEGNGENKPNPGEDNEANKDDETIKDVQDKLDEILDDLTQDNIDNIKDLIDKIEDEAKKEELLEEIKNLQELLDLTELIKNLTEKVNNATKKEDIEEARKMESENDINNRLHNLENLLVKEDAKNKLEDLKLSMAENDKILNDNQAPVVLGVNDGDVVCKVNIYYGEGEEEIKAFIGTKPITLESINNIQTEGTYTVEFYDKAFNKTTLTFTIDTTLPIISGVKEFYNFEDLETGVKLTVNDASDTIIYIEKDGMIREITGKELMLDKNYVDGTYKIWAVDKAGNKSIELQFIIDKEKPIISGVVNKVYNLADLKTNINVTVNEPDTTIYIEKDGVVNTFAGSTVIDEAYLSGTYKVWAIDKAFNKSDDIEFIIDKDAPQYKNFGVVNVSRIGTDKNVKEASIGDQIEVFVTFDEMLGEQPIIKLNNETLNVVYELVREDLHLYKAIYSVTEMTGLGEVVLSVSSYKDNALNEGSELNNSNINHEYSSVTIVKGDDVEEPGDKDDEDENLKDAFEFVKGKYFHDEKMVIGYENYAGMIIEDVSNHTQIGVTEDNPYTTTDRVYETSGLDAGTYIFTVYDLEGNVIVSAKMYYDNVNPLLSGKGVQDGESKSLVDGGTYEKLDFNVTDNALNFVTIYKDGLEVETKKFGSFGNRSYSKTFTENGTYKIVVQDKAENEVSVEFVIEKNESLLSKMMSIIGVRI